MTSRIKEVEITRDLERNKLMIGGQRIVVHCHHYNCSLQRTLEDALPQKMIDIQKQAAAEVVHDVLTNVFADVSRVDEDQFVEAVFQHATELYRIIGLGIIDFDDVSMKGGVVRSPVSHYSVAWLEKWGSHKTPVCHFTCGFINATLSFAFDKPLDFYQVEEVECVVQHKDECVFDVKVVQK